jgi:hypothetical protein
MHDSLLYNTPNWRIKVLFYSQPPISNPTPCNGGTFKTNNAHIEGHDSFLASNTFVTGAIAERVGL